MEILADLPEGSRLPQPFQKHVTRTGSRCRLEVPEAQLFPALEQLRSSGARILSVSQVKPTLEDFFFKALKKEAAEEEAEPELELVR
jgi:hypothetical protein